MNQVILIGRITKDPEVKTTQNDIAVCSFTLAVDRKFKNANGEREANFISCVAWKQTAELIGKYFQKGSKIGVIGNIQTRSYEKDGHKVYVTEIVVDQIEFVESKGESKPQNATIEPHYATIDDDTTIPFDL